MAHSSPSSKPAPATKHWVELRIHGVSGTPPEVMLESEHVQQVAGDSWGRFFRPVDGVGRPAQTDPDRLLEGYHWGKYTSGSSLKGLWLILIPFGMVNAAAFMLPDPGTGTSRSHLWHRLALGLLRGIAVGLTCTFALTAGLITIDLVGYSWASGVSWLHELGLRVTISAGLLLAAGVMAVLFALGNQNRAATFDPAAKGAIAGAPDPVGLSRTEFYTETQSAPILGRLHLAMGWSVLALVGTLTWQAIRDQTPSTPHGALQHMLWALSLAMVLGIAGLVVGLGDPEKALNATTDHFYFPILPTLSWSLVWASAFLLVADVVLLMTTRPTTLALDLDRYAKYLPLACTGAMLGLFVTCYLLGRGTAAAVSTTPAPFQRYAHGLAAWALASTGLFVGVGFCAAFDLGVGKLVGRGAQTDLIYRVAYVWGITTVAVAVLLVPIGLLVGHRRRHYAREVLRSYRRVTDPWLAHRLPGPWPRTICGARTIAALKWYLASAVVFFAVMGTVMTIVTWIEMFHWHTPGVIAWISQGRDAPPGSAPGVGVTRQSSAFTVLYNIGTYALISAAGALFVLGRRALKTENTRRGVNVVWDVISFWPHSVHPFVPPSYAQFAVKDLRRRIRFHLGLPVVPVPGGAEEVPDGAPKIVVSGHSQGSLITFAALIWLGKAELSRVRLVTYGSQLQVAFPRGFPAYVNMPLIALVRARLQDRWINLYRETDPIAGPVLSWDRETLGPAPTTPQSRHFPLDAELNPRERRDDVIAGSTGRRQSGDDWRVLDPPPVDAVLERTTLTHLSKHSGYPASADYQDAVAEVLNRP
ncbi:MAG TPA: hypothetical protein VH085_09930 [Nocardioides sp.]|nr:hypothetical protein [Nocardioides sp.]